MIWECLAIWVSSNYHVEHIPDLRRAPPPIIKQTHSTHNEQWTTTQAENHHHTHNQHQASSNSIVSPFYLFLFHSLLTLVPIAIAFSLIILSGGSCGCGYIPPGASDPAHCSSNALFSAPSGNQYGATYYGTAAISASLGGGNWLSGCGQCFKVTGTGNVGGMSGVPTTLVLKSANFCPAGNPACEVGPHFDIAAPGFDFTAASLSNNCRKLYGDDAAPFFACENWPNTSCNCSLFTDPTLREGCENFLSLGWNNVQVSYEKVDCPMELERQNCWEENGGSWPTTEPQWCANNWLTWRRSTALQHDVVANESNINQ